MLHLSHLCPFSPYGVGGGGRERDDLVGWNARGKRKTSYPQQGNLPTEQGNLPTEQGNLPTEQGNLPTEQGILPTEQGNLPTEQGNLPTEQGNLTTEQGNLPSEQGNLPTNNNYNTSYNHHYSINLKPKVKTIVPKIFGAYSNASINTENIHKYHTKSNKFIKYLRLSKILANTQNIRVSLFGTDCDQDRIT
jgi:hypothetical protein